jgi:hypothetical protein
MGIKISDIDQAKVLVQLVFDWADYNLNCWESFGDEVPKGAQEIYEKAKALNDILNKE